MMEDKKDFFRNLGETVIKHRVFVLILWIIITLISSIGALHIHDVLTGEGSYVKTSESYEQNVLLIKDFPRQYPKNVIITFESKNLNVDSPVYQEAMNKVKDSLKGNKDVGEIYGYELDPSFISKDRKTTFLLIGLTDKSVEVSSESGDRVANLLRTIKFPDEITTHITGSQVIVGDMTRLSESDGAKEEKKILPIAIIILILVFGALVSALLPVFIALMSIVITLGCLYVIGHFFELTMFCKAITSMIGLGVGLDYCLFMVSRFREEMEKGTEPKEAAILSTVTAGKAVCYSGLAVSIGMGALLIPDLPLTRSIGFSGVLVVLIAIMLSLTLLPVIFSFLGERINSPRKFHKLVKYTSGRKNFWLNWSKTVMKKPKLFLTSGVLLLLFISYFSLEMKLWNSSVLLMPKELDSRKGFETMLSIDPSRKFSPIGVSFETKDGSSIYERKNLQDIYNFAKEILSVPEIDRVLGLVNPETGSTLEEYESLYANTLALQTFGMGQQNNPFVSTDNQKSILWAIHKDSNIEIADWNTVKNLRQIRDKFNSSNLKIMIGGGGSNNVDFQNAVYEYFPLIIFLIIVATYIIMFWLLGSIILPIKAIVMNLLSVTASYGWLVLVFQYGVGSTILGLEKIPGALLIITPLVLFCIIFGLSMDYEIFMMSRIKEEYDSSQDTDYAVSVGLQRSGSIVTSAALIMIIVFSAFSFSDVILVQEMGLGLSTAVLIDATIIRIMLVPSILKILDKTAWWLPESWKDKVKVVKLEH